MKQKPIRHVVIVSDTHCGGSTALMPPEFVTIEEQTVKANAVQRWYWDQWTEMHRDWIPDVTRGEPFALVHNGDAMDGIHHRTKEIVSCELADHFDIAVECLRPLVEQSAAAFFVEGTDCHTGNMEHGLAKYFRAIGPDGRPGAWRRLDLTIGGHRCIFQHHIGTSARTWTESTGLGTALANEQLEAIRAGEVPPTVVVSAHRHRPGLYQTSSGISAVTGAWQALTRHARKVVPSARCWPSALHLEFDGSPALPRVRQFDRRPPAAGRAVDSAVSGTMGIDALLAAAGIGHEPPRIVGIEWSTAEIAKKSRASHQTTLNKLHAAQAAGKVTSRRCRGVGLRGEVEVWRPV